MPGSIEDILKQATPRERTVKVCIRGVACLRMSSMLPGIRPPSPRSPGCR